MPERSAVNEDIGGLVGTDEADRFSSPTEARKKAMDYLARREHAAGELLEKLTRAGFEADAAERAIDGLRDDGLQDERRFVESFVHSRIGQGKGPNRIRAELGQRRVAATLVEEVLADSGTDWASLAREQRVRKFGAEVPADFREKTRQMRFLHYRGFEADQIQAAVTVSGIESVDLRW